MGKPLSIYQYNKLIIPYPTVPLEKPPALIRINKPVVLDIIKHMVKLTFNIREYLDGDERTEIFQAINDEDASEEYAEHIEDYNDIFAV